MAKTGDVLALITTHGMNDDIAFFTHARRMAAQAAHAGSTRAASDLTAAIARAERSASRRKNGSTTTYWGQKPTSATGIETSEPRKRLDQLVLAESVASGVERVIEEHRGRDRLVDFGFGPIRRVLFTGAPGTGKTSAAHGLAHALDLPIHEVRLDRIIGSHLGDTAKKLREVFDAMREQPGVYFFDEIDALGAERSASGTDAAEMRRVVNSLLVFLDEDPEQGIIVAATNHPSLLDRALFRRFETRIDFPDFDGDGLVRVMQLALGTIDTIQVDWQRVAAESLGLSPADMEVSARLAAKQRILAGFSSVTTSNLLAALRERAQSRSI